VVDIAANIKPSHRGELEITDVLQLDIDRLSYSMYDGWWKDMGTFKSWTEVSQRIAEKSL
jgi:glucose-1-phosphate thymidylyltransferase